MTALLPQDPDYAARVRASFDRQSIMATIGARMTIVAPGEVEVRLPFRPDLCQQHGYLHAGITTTLVDSACGYAAMTLLPAGGDVMTVEFKVNFLAPAAGAEFVARGRVARAGRRISVCTGEVVAITAAGEKPVALMQATMTAVGG